MVLKRLGIIFLIITLAFFLISFFYIGEKRLLSPFKGNLERLFSEAIGAEVKIGRVGGNIFKKVHLYGLGCQLKDFRIDFDQAQLEYSLWQVLSKKKSSAEVSSNHIRLEGGWLRFKENLLISKQINGIISLSPDKIAIEELGFRTFSSFDNRLKGEIIKGKDKDRLNLFLTIEPFFDRERTFFPKASLDIEGQLDNLRFSGRIKRDRGPEILLDGNFVLSEEGLAFSSNLDFKDSQSERTNRILAKARVDLKNSSFMLNLYPGQGKVIINGDCSKWPLVTADITNDHIRFSDLDFSNIIHLAAEFILENGDFSNIGLELYTESTILNFYPFDELEGSFWIDKDLFRIIYLKVGDSLSGSGVLSLKAPLRAFLKATLTEFDISRLLTVSKEERSPIASGRVSGQAVIEGPLNELRTKVNLGAKRGYLGTVDYENMLLNMEGQGPILTIYDSRLIREDSFLTLEGTVDLRKFGQERFLENLSVSTDPNTIVWEGWDITKAADRNELRLSKGLNGRVKVGFTKQISDETAYQAVKPQDEFELKYKMLDEESLLQFKAKENEEFLGLMKKYKF